MYSVSRVHERVLPEKGRYAIPLGIHDRPTRLGLGLYKHQLNVSPNSHSVHVEFPLAPPVGSNDDFLVDVSRTSGVTRMPDVVAEDGPWRGIFVARYRIDRGGMLEIGSRNKHARTCRESLLIEAK